MIAPVFHRGEDLYIILEADFAFKDVGRAVEEALIAQASLGFHELTFRGNFIPIDDTLKTYPVNLPLLDMGNNYRIGLIGGPSYEAIQRGETVEGLLMTDIAHVNNSLFITQRIEMDDKDLTIAIGIEEESFEPFVLIGFGEETQAVSPMKARTIAEDLQFAAKSAEVDSFFYKSLGHVFKDISERQQQDFLEAYRAFRAEYMERLNAKEEADSEEIAEEDSTGTVAGTLGGETAQNGTAPSEEVGESGRVEEGKKALEEAIKKANSQGLEGNGFEERTN